MAKILYGEDIIKLLPDLFCDTLLAKKIYDQTVNESKNTLVLIENRINITYMGIKRGASFLCVWFMRSFCRGLIAFSMLKEKVFSLNVLNCCEEFLKRYPEYDYIIGECQKLERLPTNDWKHLEVIAKTALDIYMKIGEREMGW